MIIPAFFIIHWYVSFFLQSLFHHRYAAHNHFTMSKRAEKFFFIACFFAHGSSYMSPHAYGIMHRLHHIHTDTEDDPHSPHNEPDFFRLMFVTRNSYQKYYTSAVTLHENIKKNLPEWKEFESFAHNWITRSCWILVYVAVYVLFATAWWMYLFLPITITMAAFQGNIINWVAHKFGYENFKMKNTSKNILPIDIIFIGDAYHNNHHKFPGKVNNSQRWFEADIIYHIMNLMHYARIIHLKK